MKNALVLLSLMLIFLIGCSGDNSENNSPTASELTLAEVQQMGLQTALNKLISDGNSNPVKRLFEIGITESEFNGLEYGGGLIYFARQNGDETWINVCSKNDITEGNESMLLFYAGNTLCENLTLGGYDDWVLPELDQLRTIRLHLYQLGFGDFSDGFYWSATESYAANCTISGCEKNIMNITTGIEADNQYENSYGLKNRVRAVRYIILND
ncbi:hypothetical protein [Flavobacterium sp.]|uniref:hypothetical protein n=1 Tax=Flavobacterium sp. TaxID=239 RepID=UPI00262437AE|nr:hypothetical protein [Flavobacterium sp.]